ncbi:hypothetical protein FIV42_28325 [Persicimonas caeni]|uniref:Tetratricopeptide repeat protein n=1 Tax=Persicimonas caeni TaxID=2292766 RepID=A0A4Y6Q215_PERCE|nr:hypothetical protein [Persicimonas caeni]QDG54509.1 hypothetical protein FIV42_28325 [Persicimonas caeni]QED35730.1 hypothetical protein FRD00_28320 [Persicimonas caeni]
MGNKLSSNVPQPSKLDATIIAGLLICALLAAGFAYWRMGPAREVTDEDFQFPELTVNQQKLEQQRQEKYADVNLQQVQGEWQELIAAARQVHRAQFGGVSQEEQLKRAATVKVWANETVLGSGFDAFVVTGEPVFRECATGLDTLLGAIQSGQVTMDEAKANPPAEEFAAYRDNCGKLLPVLVERGLVTEEGKWSSKVSPHIVDLLNRYRWAHIIHDQKDPWAQLTKEGALAFARWRVEDAIGYTLEERQKFLAKLARQFPNYNAGFAYGMLAYKAGDYEKALEYFDRLAKAQPRSDYQRYAEYLRQKVGGAKGDPAGGAGDASESGSKDESATVEKSH